MKAVSIKQPWASLIAAGIKTLEIRAWPTVHRGPLLICSSRRPVIDGHRHGVSLCIVDVTDCRAMQHGDVPFACVDQFYPGQFAWILENVRLVKPVPVLGQLRLFDVPDKSVHVLNPITVEMSTASPGRKSPARWLK